MNPINTARGGVVSAARFAPLLTLNLRPLVALAMFFARGIASRAVMLLPSGGVEFAVLMASGVSFDSADFAYPTCCWRRILSADFALRRAIGERVGVERSMTNRSPEKRRWRAGLGSEGVGQDKRPHIAARSVGCFCWPYFALRQGGARNVRLTINAF
ncbi:MAG: hypothetical protein P4L57_11515, partial [Rhizomicrobium sp.]|nr:hypothetical protein [Rhizomicrobium sp.]